MWEKLLCFLGFHINMSWGEIQIYTLLDQKTHSLIRKSLYQTGKCPDCGKVKICTIKVMFP
jgi:hypothetical protein